MSASSTLSAHQGSAAVASLDVHRTHIHPTDKPSQVPASADPPLKSTSLPTSLSPLTHSSQPSVKSNEQINSAGFPGYSMRTGASSISGLRNVNAGLTSEGSMAENAGFASEEGQDGAIITGSEEGNESTSGGSTSLSPTSGTDETSSEERASDNSKSNSAELIEARVLDQLKARDIEVRAHERAHASVGGIHAQSPSYEYQRGSDGQRYAVGGEVQIDVTPLKNDPVATIAKMKQVYAAAMAPVDPSMADIRVAATALQHMNEAKQELTDSMFDKGPKLEDSESIINLDKQDEASDTAFSANGNTSVDNGDDTNIGSVSIPVATLETAYGLAHKDSAKLALQV